MHTASLIPDEEDYKRITKSRRSAQIQSWLGKEQREYFFCMRSFAVTQVKVLIYRQSSVVIRTPTLYFGDVYSDGGFLYSSSVLPDKYWKSALKSALDHFHIPLGSSFINHPVIQYYIMYAPISHLSKY
jgi:hypothetical protein